MIQPGITPESEVPPSEAPRSLEPRPEAGADAPPSMPSAADPFPSPSSEPPAIPNEARAEAQEPSPPTPAVEPERISLELVRQLEERIRRLEETVSALTEKKRIEVEAAPPPAPPVRESARPSDALAPAAKPEQPESALPPPEPEPEAFRFAAENVTVDGSRRRTKRPPAEIPSPVAEEPSTVPPPNVPMASLAPAPPVAAFAPMIPVAAAAPVAVPAAPAGTPGQGGFREWIQAGRRVLANPAATKAAAAAVVPVARAAAAALAAPAPISPSPFYHPWLLMEAYHEFRAVIRMYTDRSYRPSVYAWTIPAVALALMICSYFFFSWGMQLFGLGAILDRIIDLLLAFFAYKVMVREAARHEAAKAAAGAAS